MDLGKIFMWAGGSTVFASTLLDISHASMISEFYSWAMIPLKTATGVLLAWAMNKWIIKPMELAGGWVAWAKSLVRKKPSSDSDR